MQFEKSDEKAKCLFNSCFRKNDDQITFVQKEKTSFVIATRKSKDANFLLQSVSRNSNLNIRFLYTKKKTKQKDSHVALWKFFSSQWLLAKKSIHPRDNIVWCMMFMFICTLLSHSIRSRIKAFLAPYYALVVQTNFWA